MAAERDLERRVADALHAWLDAEPAPHPRWEDAPARSLKPIARSIPAPLRLLAVAALVAGAAGGALWVGGQLLGPDADDRGGIARFCAPVEAYPPPGAEIPAPTAAPWPEIGPEAPLSAGVLQPGDVAILGDAEGPGALLRISDPRLCERYPTARPEIPGTTWAVVRMEMRVLRDGFMAPWLDGEDRIMIRSDGDPRPFEVQERVYGVPGVHRRSRLETPAGFEAVTDLVFTLDGGPADDLSIEYRTPEGDLDTRGRPVVVSWAIGTHPAREPVNIAAYWAQSPPDLSGPPASGRVGLGEWSLVENGDRPYAVRATELDQVDRYPAADPELGAFVEVKIGYSSEGSDDQLPAIGTHEWRAVDGAGRELALLERPAEAQSGVLNPMLSREARGGWLLIDAPPEGEVILEYRRNGEGPVLFEVLVRRS